jgi:hypothetical protein
MPLETIVDDHFKFSYRADCIDCEKYVGPKRKSKPDAEADMQSHKNQPEYKDHEVKIEVTQRYYI